jgi:hypothetical protein
MPSKKQTESEISTDSLDNLSALAIELGKHAGDLSQALTEHVNKASRVDHGDVGAGPATIRPIDHTMRSKLNTMIVALNDFRMQMRHSQLVGEHDEEEKVKIIRDDYC